MSQPPDDRYVRVITRLALGIQPMDAISCGRIAGPLYCVFDDAAIDDEARARLTGADRDVTDLLRREAWPGDHDPLRRLRRSDTGRHVLIHTAELARSLAAQAPDPAEAPHPEPYVDLRLVEGPMRSAPRRFVPRRFRFRIPPLVADDDSTPAARLNRLLRLRRPRLYPGAAYELSESSTAIRGYVERGGKPLRWARVQAKISGTVVGDAHGDDRGEFLLVLRSSEGVDVGAARAATVQVTAWGPDLSIPPDPDRPEHIRKSDPLDDLPLERPRLEAADDDVLLGTARPRRYEKLHTQDLTVPLGRITSAHAPFVIPS